MAQGLQNIPLRVPTEWDAAWYLQHIREVLALADIRNASGDGIEITGQSDEAATLTVSEDIQNLLLQPFVLTSPSGFLEFERVLAAGDAIEITDNGAGSTIQVGIENNSISLGKLLPLSDMGILGNPVDAPGAVQNIQAAVDGDVLTRQGTDLLFTNAPVWTGIHRWIDGIAAQWGTDSDLAIAHSGSAGTITNITGALTVSSTAGNLALSAAAGDITFTAPALTDFLFNGETLAEIAQDAVGTILVDSSTIDFTYVDGGPSITASVIQSFAYQWSANHTWADNAEVRVGTDGDGRIYHDGSHTYIRNDTGGLRVLDGATQLGEWDERLYLSITKAQADAISGLVATPAALVADSRILLPRAAGAPAIRQARINTSYASPSAVANGNSLGSYQSGGFDGSAVEMAVDFNASATENWTASARGADWFIQTVAQGSTALTSRVRIGATASTNYVRLLADNQELQIGASQDLRQYHDGTHSIIENDTGNLILRVGGELALEEVTTSTGAVTCTLGTNAPAGVGTTTPTTWMTLLVGGTTYFIPLWT